MISYVRHCRTSGRKSWSVPSVPAKPLRKEDAVGSLRANDVQATTGPSTGPVPYWKTIHEKREWGLPHDEHGRASGHNLASLILSSINRALCARVSIEVFDRQSIGARLG